MTDEHPTTSVSTSWGLPDVRLMTLAALMGVATAFFGGILVGWASSGRPSTLTQAVQQAAAGALPSGVARSPAEPVHQPPRSSEAPSASAYDLAFFGTVYSVGSGQIGVETRAGQVAVQLTRGTRFATADVASTNRESISDHRSVLIVPEPSTRGSTEPVAGTVVLLPN